MNHHHDGRRTGEPPKVRTAAERLSSLASASSKPSTHVTSVKNPIILTQNLRPTKFDGKEHQQHPFLLHNKTPEVTAVKLARHFSKFVDDKSLLAVATVNTTASTFQQSTCSAFSTKHTATSSETDSERDEDGANVKRIRRHAKQEASPSPSLSSKSSSSNCLLNEHVEVDDDCLTASPSSALPQCPLPPSYFGYGMMVPNSSSFFPPLLSNQNAQFSNGSGCPPPPLMALSFGCNPFQSIFSAQTLRPPQTSSAAASMTTTQIHSLTTTATNTWPFNNNINNPTSSTSAFAPVAAPSFPPLSAADLKSILLQQATAATAVQTSAVSQYPLQIPPPSYHPATSTSLTHSTLLPSPLPSFLGMPPVATQTFPPPLAGSNPSLLSPHNYPVFRHWPMAAAAAAAAAYQQAHFPHLSSPYEPPKPPYSYIGLIAMAILSTPEKKMMLNEIYAWIQARYDYFHNRGHGWRNSIRHNLSLNDCFQKAGRAANGKGNYWQVNPANLEDFKRGDFRRRRAQRKARRAANLDVDADDDDDDDDGPLQIIHHDNVMGIGGMINPFLPYGFNPCPPAVFTPPLLHPLPPPPPSLFAGNLSLNSSTTTTATDILQNEALCFQQNRAITSDIPVVPRSDASTVKMPPFESTAKAKKSNGFSIASLLN